MSRPGYRHRREERERRLTSPALVVVVGNALLLGVIALASRSGRSDDSDDSAAIGFPIVLVLPAGVSAVGVFVWRAVSKQQSDHRSALQGGTGRASDSELGGDERTNSGP